MEVPSRRRWYQLRGVWFTAAVALLAALSRFTAWEPWMAMNTFSGQIAQGVLLAIALGGLIWSALRGETRLERAQQRRDQQHRDDNDRILERLDQLGKWQLEHPHATSTEVQEKLVQLRGTIVSMGIARGTLTVTPGTGGAAA